MIKNNTLIQIGFFILFILAIGTCIVYLPFFIAVCLQWHNVDDFFALDFSEKFYLIIASFYWLYAPILIVMSWKDRKKGKMTMFIPYLFLALCIIYICFNINCLSMSEA